MGLFIKHKFMLLGIRFGVEELFLTISVCLNQWQTTFGSLEPDLILIQTLTRQETLPGERNRR